MHDVKQRRLKAHFPKLLLLAAIMSLLGTFFTSGLLQKLMLVLAAACAIAGKWWSYLKDTPPK